MITTIIYDYGVRMITAIIYDYNDSLRLRWHTIRYRCNLISSL